MIQRFIETDTIKIYRIQFKSVYQSVETFRNLKKKITDCMIDDVRHNFPTWAMYFLCNVATFISPKKPMNRLKITLFTTTFSVKNKLHFVHFYTQCCV